MTIRLTMLEGAGRSNVDRCTLLEGLLQCWRAELGDTLSAFNIDGPYGISKGRFVGRQAFENKLRRNGHAAYNGYSAWDGERAGLNVSFFDSPPYGTKFVEVLLWFLSSEVQADAEKIVRRIADVVHIDYGYVAELPGNFSPLGEVPIKRSIFGASTQVGNSALNRWYKRIHVLGQGGVRDIYPINFLNSKQIEAFRRHGEFEVTAVAESLSMLRVDDVDQIVNLKIHLRELCDAQQQVPAS